MRTGSYPHKIDGLIRLLFELKSSHSVGFWFARSEITQRDAVLFSLNRAGSFKSQHVQNETLVPKMVLDGGEKNKVLGYLTTRMIGVCKNASLMLGRNYLPILSAGCRL